MNFYQASRMLAEQLLDQEGIGYTQIGDVLVETYTDAGTCGEGTCDLDYEVYTFKVFYETGVMDEPLPYPKVFLFYREYHSFSTLFDELLGVSA